MSLSKKAMETALGAIVADIEDYGRGGAVEGNCGTIADLAAAGTELEAELENLEQRGD